MDTNITLSAATVPCNVDAGTVIGLFNADNLKFQDNPFGYFVIVGRMLCTTWNGQAMPGPQTIQVHAPGGPPASFTITITVPVALAVPISISLSQSTVSLVDNAAAATKLASAIIKMSDGSAFAGVLSVAPIGLVMPMALDLILARALTAADDGTRSFTVTATQNGTAVSAPVTLTVAPATSMTPSPDGTTITAPSVAVLVDGAGNQWGFGAASKSWSGQYDILRNGKPVSYDSANYWGGNILYILAGGHLYFTNPSKQSWEWNGSTFVSTPLPGTPPPPPPPLAAVTGVTVSPASPVLSDAAPAGAMVSTATVTMSDGSKYTGALTISPASTLFAVSGINIVTGRGVAASDDGSYALTVSAGGKSAALNVTVKALPPPPSPTPIITVNPAAPSISDTTPLGTTVATFSVTMSDGSPFTGTVQFGSPNFDNGGVFALSGNSIIVNPKGPGVGPNMTTITDHITLQATS